MEKKMDNEMATCILQGTTLISGLSCSWYRVPEVDINMILGIVSRIRPLHQFLTAGSFKKPISSLCHIQV